MPFLKIQTNHPLPEPDAKTLAAKASALVAKQLGKPERYVMVSVALLRSQSRNVLARPMGALMTGVFLGCGVVGGCGTCYSLARGDVTVDMIVIAAVLIVSELIRRGRPFRHRPINIVLETGCLLTLLLLLAR